MMMSFIFSCFFFGNQLYTDLEKVGEREKNRKKEREKDMKGSKREGVKKKKKKIDRNRVTKV